MAFIREPHPLKQGLKLYKLIHLVKGWLIREPHPLKQGLKHAPAASDIAQTDDSRATSIKTRIETMNFD